MVTDEEKRSRRQKVKQKRRQRGKKARPLPPRKTGADQSYKEFKIVAFYDETQKHRLVSGTRGDHEAAGRLMRREAARIRLDLADEKVGNVDGSPWIRNQVRRQCLPLDDLGLDFYHLSENAHKARRDIYGEDDDAGKQWVDKLLHTFKHGGYEPTWQQLLEWRVGLRRGQRQAADRLLNYVSERREMIKYPEFLAKGWQIGSGPTEATCKTLTARLKGSGMRWDAENAEALMALEALTKVANGTCTGKVSYGLRVRYARKFCHTHRRAGIRHDQVSAGDPQVPITRTGEGVGRVATDLPDAQSSEDLAPLQQRREELRGQCAPRAGPRPKRPKPSETQGACGSMG